MRKAGYVSLLGVVVLLLALAVGAQAGDMPPAEGEAQIVGSGPYVAFILSYDYTRFGLGKGATQEEAKANALASCGDPTCSSGESGSMTPLCIFVAKHDSGKYELSYDFREEGARNGALKNCEQTHGSPCEIIGGICSDQ